MVEWLEFLPWDTDFFGLKIGRIVPRRLKASDLQTYLPEAEHAGFQCLYMEADPHDPVTVDLVERHGFQLVDVRIVLEYPFDGRPAPIPRFPTSDNIRLGPVRAEDKIALEEIAVEIGQMSRYRFDRKFPPDACPRLYLTWLNKAMQDQKGDVLVAYLEDIPAGLIAVDVVNITGHIHLAGVYSRYRGLGVGTALVQASLDWFRQRDTRRAEVVTQARNVPAQRLYQQMGFYTCRTSLFYHKWFQASHSARDS